MKIDLQLIYSNGNVQRVAILYGVVSLLHGVLDPAISYIIVKKGIGIEANPFLRPLFGHGALAILIAHLPLFGILVVCFLSLLYLFTISEEDDRKQLYLLSQLTLTVFALWGMILVGRNLYILLVY